MRWANAAGLGYQFGDAKVGIGQILEVLRAF